MRHSKKRKITRRLPSRHVLEDTESDPDQSDLSDCSSSSHSLNEAPSRTSNIDIPGENSGSGSPAHRSSDGKISSEIPSRNSKICINGDNYGGGSPSHSSKDDDDEKDTNLKRSSVPNKQINEGRGTSANRSDIESCDDDSMGDIESSHEVPNRVSIFVLSYRMISVLYSLYNILTLWSFMSAFFPVKEKV